MSFLRFLFYATTQLAKMHRQFAHPSASKLFNLLKRAGTEAVDAKTFNCIRDIIARCEPCQRIYNAPVRFRVSSGHEHVRFNARAYNDIMYLDGKPVLHIVDEATRFSAARFLPKVSTDAVWDSLILCWSSVYTGLPHHVMVDEGSQLRKIFAELSALHDVKLEQSGIESHYILGIGERYHKPLRDTYRKLKLDHPSMQRQVLLALAVKAMNDTLGPEGYVPSSLVFGEFPSLRTFVGPIIPHPTLAGTCPNRPGGQAPHGKTLGPNASIHVRSNTTRQVPTFTYTNLVTKFSFGEKNLLKIASANGLVHTLSKAMMTIHA